MFDAGRRIMHDCEINAEPLICPIESVLNPIAAKSFIRTFIE